MDRRSLLLATRLAGTAALTALLLYGGAAMARPGVTEPEAAAWTVLGFLLAWTGAWGLASRARAGLLVGLAAAGVAPVAAFVGWLVAGQAGGAPLRGLLALAFVAGLATLAAGGWTLARLSRPGPVRRVPRPG